MVFQSDILMIFDVVSNCKKRFMKLLLSLLGLLYCVSGLEAQYHITFDIDNYESDTVIVGYYIMDKQLVLDSLVNDSTDIFTLQGEDTLSSGVYILLTQPDNQFIQFMVNEKEQLTNIEKLMY